jgi:hypothetical protein
MKLDHDINPKITNTYSIGSNSKRWNVSYLNKIDTPSVLVDNNTITAVDTNLQLWGNGTAGVQADRITFKGNVISTTVSDIVLKPKPLSASNLY